MPFRQWTATTTAQQVVAFNAKRSTIVIRNASGATVYISIDSTGVVTAGWPLAPGDFVGFIQRDGDDSAAAIYAQTAAATTDLRIQESYGEVTP
jgi:hypothetical protein